MRLIQVFDSGLFMLWVNAGDGNITHISYSKSFSTLTIYFVGGGEAANLTTQDPNRIIATIIEGAS